MATPLLALVLLRPETPAGAALAWSTQALVVTPVLAWVILRELGQSPLWLLRQVAPGIVAAVAMVMAVLLTQPVMGGVAPLVRLVSSSAVEAIVFVSVAWLALGRRLPRALIQAAAATRQESLHDGMAPLSAEAAS